MIIQSNNYQKKYQNFGQAEDKGGVYSFVLPVIILSGLALASVLMTIGGSGK